MINISLKKIKLLKKLGFGIYGTIYLVKINNKKYALKVQKIINRKEIIKELELYEFINKINNDDQKFFTKLYKYEFDNKCKHSQKRYINIDSKASNNFSKEITKHDISPYCLRYIMDYHGNKTLSNYLIYNKLSKKNIYSIILQCIKIHLVLFKGGYSHNDLHNNNIMVRKTKDVYFTFMKNKIPYYGIQLVAIDYGMVSKKRSEKLLLKDIIKNIMNIVSNFLLPRKEILELIEKNNVKDIVNYCCEKT